MGFLLGLDEFSLLILELLLVPHFHLLMVSPIVSTGNLFQLFLVVLFNGIAPLRDYFSQVCKADMRLPASAELDLV